MGRGNCYHHLGFCSFLAGGSGMVWAFLRPRGCRCFVYMGGIEVLDGAGQGLTADRYLDSGWLLKAGHFCPVRDDG